MSDFIDEGTLISASDVSNMVSKALIRNRKEDNDGTLMELKNKMRKMHNQCADIRKEMGNISIVAKKLSEKLGEDLLKAYGSITDCKSSLEICCDVCVTLMTERSE